jgi:drug/metabolite transporter (DMT)-like permease
MHINVVKNTIGVVGFILFLIIQGNRFPVFTFDEMRILTISAVLGVAIGDYFYLSALRNLGAGLNAIVGTTFSLSIFILSYLMFGEVIALRGYFGGVLVISGIVIATVEVPKNKSRKDITQGIIFGLIAQVLTAFSVLMIKPVMAVHPVVPIALIRFGIGTLLGIIFLYYTEGGKDLIKTYKKGFSHIPLVLGAFFGTFLSVIFWLAGYKYTLAGRAAIYNQLSTILIILMAALFLKEKMNKRKWFAVCCALSGAILVSTA